jgi:hypothetical protein
VENFQENYRPDRSYFGSGPEGGLQPADSRRNRQSTLGDILPRSGKTNAVAIAIRVQKGKQNVEAALRIDKLDGRADVRKGFQRQ